MKENTLKGSRDLINRPEEAKQAYVKPSPYYSTNFRRAVQWLAMRECYTKDWYYINRQEQGNGGKYL